MMLTAVAMVTSGLVFNPTATLGQNATNTEQRVGERAGEVITNTAERTGEAATDAANRTGGVLVNPGNDTVNQAGDAGRTGNVQINPANDTANRTNTDANRAMGTDTGTAAQTTAKTAMAAPDAEDIHGTLAAATEAFVKKGTFDDLVERFVDADRNRIGADRYAEKEHEDLNDAIDRFQNAWKAKYNKPFDIVDEAVVYNDQHFRIMQSEIGQQTETVQSAQTASGAINVNANTPDGTAEIKMKDGTTNNDVVARTDTGVDAPTGSGKGAEDHNRNDVGRNIATVTVNNAMGNLQVPMIHEAPDAWKIDVSDSIDGPKLKNNVIAQLDAAVAMKAQWPDDHNEAYRAITTHMLKAVLEQPEVTK
jgi:hypothetical protein